MAAIKKRGRRQWQARIRRKGYPVQTKTFYTKADAQSWAREIENEIDRGVFLSRKEAESTTLREGLLRYKAEYIPRLAHAHRECVRVDQILEYSKKSIADKYLAAIRTKDVNEYIKTRLKHGAAANTIRLELALLSKFFEVAGSDWGMESLFNPVKRASKPKLPAGRDRRLKKDELDKILKQAPLILQNIINFALETAMRRSEIVRLNFANIDFISKTAYLSKTKNGEARTVPLSPAAIKILKQQIQVTPINGSVFDVKADWISQQFRKSCKKAGVNDVRFHDLRHEAISRLFENTDLDLMEIKEISGHKSMQMLARYSHLRSSRLAKRLAGEKRGR